MKNLKGVEVESGEIYTASAVPYSKGVIFFDETGKEIGVHIFKKNKKEGQSFIAPANCKSVGFLIKNSKN